VAAAAAAAAAGSASQGPKALICVSEESELKSSSVSVSKI
jgi:hypothetical protein